MIENEEKKGGHIIYQVLSSRKYLRHCRAGCFRSVELSLLHFILKFIGGYLLIAPRKRKVW